MSDLPSVLMVGTGEYTTGYVHSEGSKSDKKIGVVGLSLFYLRSIGKVGKLLMSGTNGTKFPAIRDHFETNIAKVYKGMEDVTFESFPKDDVQYSPKAYLEAMDTLQKGDLVTIFTPDDTHYEICKAALERGLHVLVTKPCVKQLNQHLEIIELAKKNNCFLMVEDPIYSDARSRMTTLGDFSYFNSYMSQPKFQLETFKNWAGKSSDISYYLNSHHIDLHCWGMQNKAIPTKISAFASNGVASSVFSLETEDTITITTQWKNLESNNLGIGIYTASWISPESDVHSQQKFHYIGHKGEINADQAHRGYTVAEDDNKYKSVNPMYMKYTPDARGRFSGQNGYGFVSIEKWVDSSILIRNKENVPSDFDIDLPTLNTTTLDSVSLFLGFPFFCILGYLFLDSVSMSKSSLQIQSQWLYKGTAILEGGRISLENNNCFVEIEYDQKNNPIALKLLK